MFMYATYYLLQLYDKNCVFLIYLKFALFASNEILRTSSLIYRKLSLIQELLFKNDLKNFFKEIGIKSICTTSGIQISRP